MGCCYSRHAASAQETETSTEEIRVSGMASADDIESPPLVPRSISFFAKVTAQTPRAKKVSGIQFLMGHMSMKRTRSTGSMDFFGDVERMADHFSIGKELGEGAYAVVHEVKRKQAKNEKSKKRTSRYAAKIYEKDGYEHEDGSDGVKELIKTLSREVGVLRTLDHPGIITLEGVYQCDDNYYVVSEMLPGGDLLDFLVDEGGLGDDDLRPLLRALLKALHYCHKKNVVHSDIKLDVSYACAGALGAVANVRPTLTHTHTH